MVDGRDYMQQAFIRYTGPQYRSLLEAGLQSAAINQYYISQLN